MNIFKKIIFAIMILLFCFIVFLFVIFNVQYDKSKLFNINLDDRGLSVNFQEGYVGAAEIRLLDKENSKFSTVYDKTFNQKLSQFILSDYHHLLKNNVIYSFSLYNYEYGNHHFTSINFCLKGDKVISENDFYFYKQFTDHCQAD